MKPRQERTWLLEARCTDCEGWFVVRPIGYWAETLGITRRSTPAQRALLKSLDASEAAFPPSCPACGCQTIAGDWRPADPVRAARMTAAFGFEEQNRL